MPGVSQRGSHPNHQFDALPLAARWTLALTVLLAMAMHGCSDEVPVVESRGMVDFMGEVERVEFDPN